MNPKSVWGSPWIAFAESAAIKMPPKLLAAGLHPRALAHKHSVVFPCAIALLAALYDAPWRRC